ncbi:MAG: class I SAM-dependent methyltransferase [Planctomycetaceae bacterium]
MGWGRDLRVLWHLALAPVRGETHAERLASFYAGQAEDYDDFRRRLLHGREALFHSLQVPPGSRWLDMGGGTGANLEQAPWRESCAEVTVVDLCEPLLEQCRRRVTNQGWRNVRVVGGDATEYTPSTPVDLVTFSYSLTMIPDWFAAIDRAWQNLRPGGADCGRGFLRIAQIPRARAGPARVVHTHIPARVVRDRQCASQPGSHSLPAAAVCNGAT